MKKTESWLKGLVKRETIVFLSKNLDHVEIIQTITLFGFWNVKEETREVFLPDVKITEQGKLRVIADAYKEMHEVITELRKGGIA